MSENDQFPLRNKVLEGLYPPGSTVKPMNALALRRAGIDPHQTVFGGGAIRVGTGVFHCWKRGGHGHTDMRRAVAQSRDVYFFQMARDLGYDAFAPTVRLLGMGLEVDLPFPSTASGLVARSPWHDRNRVR